MSGYNFKNEDDVREYLKNLFTEYKFGCYGEKKAEVCHLLGDYYEAIKKDFKEASQIYQKNCDNLEYGRSCAKIGGWMLIGKGCKKDMAEGFMYIKKGCDLGDGIGCTNAGIISISNAIHEKRPDKKLVIDNGIKFLKKACDVNKSEKACFFLADLYARGINDTVEKNSRDAYKYSLLACEYGVPMACMNLSRMHEQGDGVEKSEKLANAFKLRSQELEEEYKKYQQTMEFGQGIKI